ISAKVRWRSLFAVLLTIISSRPKQEMPNCDGAQQSVAIAHFDFGSFPAAGRPIFYQTAQPRQIKGSGRRWAVLETIKLIYDAIARGREVFVPVGHLQTGTRLF